MHQFRVTKYNPANRDGKGTYRRNEWTSHGDIGRTFDGVTLTQAGYDAVEDAYVTAAIGFMREVEIETLKVAGLEISGGAVSGPSEGSMLDHAALSDVLRQVLREAFWCRFEAANAFIHVGYDYYMYIGVSADCPQTQAAARALGLYVEPFASPYNSQI